MNRIHAHARTLTHSPASVAYIQIPAHAHIKSIGMRETEKFSRHFFSLLKISIIIIATGLPVSIQMPFTNCEWMRPVEMHDQLRLKTDIVETVLQSFSPIFPENS